MALEFLVILLGLAASFVAGMFVGQLRANMELSRVLDAASRNFDESEKLLRRCQQDEEGRHPSVH